MVQSLKITLFSGNSYNFENGAPSRSINNVGKSSRAHSKAAVPDPRWGQTQISALNPAKTGDALVEYLAISS